MSFHATKGRRGLGSLRRWGRIGRSASRPDPTPPESFTPGAYDSWLEQFRDLLEPLDDACAGGGPETLELFRELDDDLWALLLTQEYEVFPNIRRVLPDVPEPGLQQIWNGASGAALASQSSAFYTKLLARFGQHSTRLLHSARVLDFGCGWGRLTRFLGRDVAPGNLYGCDPSEPILELCREHGVPARFGRTDFLPERLPFDGPFDLVFSFSVFTHISEAAHDSCLRALHAAMAPGGVLVVTVRPPEYLSLSPAMHATLASLGPGYLAELRKPRYLFVPHPVDKHPQYDGGEMTYGEAVITLPYIRERWSDMFELLEVDLLVGDLHQMMITLRRR